MRQPADPTMGEVRANEIPMPVHGLEVCEETGDRLFRAGEYVAPGEYVETETRHHITLTSPNFLPARLAGHVACYRLARPRWGQPVAQNLVRRQAHFQRLVECTHQRLYTYTRRILRNTQDAEDVTQETLARAWAHFETFDLSRPFDAWVFRIASNIMIDRKRRQSRRPEISLNASVAGESRDESIRFPAIADRSSNPEDCLMANEVSAELQSALHTLSPLHRTTLLLLAQDRTYEQIAEAFGCPMGTIRSRVHRARVLVRRNLKEIVRHE